MSINEKGLPLFQQINTETTKDILTSFDNRVIEHYKQTSIQEEKIMETIVPTGNDDLLVKENDTAAVSTDTTQSQIDPPSEDPSVITKSEFINMVSDLVDDNFKPTVVDLQGIIVDMNGYSNNEVADYQMGDEVEPSESDYECTDNNISAHEEEYEVISDLSSKEKWLTEQIGYITNANNNKEYYILRNELRVSELADTSLHFVFSNAVVRHKDDSNTVLLIGSARIKSSGSKDHPIITEDYDLEFRLIDIDKYISTTSIKNTIINDDGTFSSSGLMSIVKEIVKTESHINTDLLEEQLPYYEDIERFPMFWLADNCSDVDPKSKDIVVVVRDKTKNDTYVIKTNFMFLRAKIRKSIVSLGNGTNAVQLKEVNNIAVDKDGFILIGAATVDDVDQLVIVKTDEKIKVKDIITINIKDEQVIGDIVDYITPHLTTTTNVFVINKERYLYLVNHVRSGNRMFTQLMVIDKENRKLVTCNSLVYLRFISIATRGLGINDDETLIVCTVNTSVDNSSIAPNVISVELDKEEKSIIEHHFLVN